MKHIKNIIFSISFLCLICFSINATDDKNKQSEIVTDYTPLPTPTISIFIDDGDENPRDELFFPSMEIKQLKEISNNPVTSNLAKAFTTTTKSPIFVSESLMNNLIARQTIIQDFLTLPNDVLLNKYKLMPKFATQEDIDLFKSACIALNENNITIKTSVVDFQKNQSITALDDLHNVIMSANTKVENIALSLSKKNKNSEQIKNYIDDIVFNYLPFVNALNPNEWLLLKTADGSFFGVPKNQLKEIDDAGFNYKNLDNANGNLATDIFNDFSNNMSKYLINNSTDTDQHIYSLIEIIKNIKNGHGYLEGHGQAATKTESGFIAGIDIDFFNAVFLPSISKNFKTFTYETCFGADINAQSAFKAKDGSPGVHSCTIISGNSTLTTITEFLVNYIDALKPLLDEEYALYKSTGNFSNQEEFKQKLIDAGFYNRFNSYFDTMTTSLNKAVSNFFIRDKTSIEGLLAIPLIKLATTDNWILADYVRDNILQISNIKNLIKSADKKEFIYDLKKGGGLLLSSETIITPIIIKLGAELPFIVPLSIGEKTHYIKNLTIEDPSISLNMFLDKSIRPFIKEMNGATEIKDNKAEKTIIIDNLKIKEGTVSLVITKNWALYTIQEEGLNSVGKPKFHYIEFSNSASFAYRTLSNFEKILEGGRQQALKEELHKENIENISTKIHDRQKSLRLIQKITEKINWNTYSKNHDLSDKNSILNAIIDAIKKQDNLPLNKEFFLKLSQQERQIIFDVLKTSNTDYIKSNEIKTALTKTLFTVQTEFERYNLLEILNNKVSIGNTALYDWYDTLDENQQDLIHYEFNAALTFTEDADTLSIAERTLLENYIKLILSITTNESVINDFTEKLNALLTPQNKDKFDKHLKDTVKTFIESESIGEFIDWISALTTEEKVPIIDDISTFFIKIIAKDPTLQNYNFDLLNSTELFILKINIEQFLQKSEINKQTILEKTSIDIDTFLSQISITKKLVNTKIEVILNNLPRDKQAFLLFPDSINIYSQIFKTLSFKTQKGIINNLELLKNSPNDVLNYQQSLVDERIKTARTPNDFLNLQNDITDAGVQLTETQKILLNSSFTSAQEAENKALFEHLPFSDAGFTGTIRLDPTIINQETGQPIIINNDPKNPNNPSDQTKHEITPGQFVPEGTKDFENKDLQENKERLEKEQKNREDTATAARDSNQKAQDEARRRREAGNDEPVPVKIP